MLLAKIFNTKQTWDVRTVGLSRKENIPKFENYRVTIDKRNIGRDCGCTLGVRETSGEMCGCTLMSRLRIKGRPGMEDVCISLTDK